MIVDNHFSVYINLEHLVSEIELLFFKLWHSISLDSDYHKNIERIYTACDELSPLSSAARSQAVTTLRSWMFL